MKINDLTRINEAPTKGMLIAYLRSKVDFNEYMSINDVINQYKDTEILEIHMFDDTKEYRAISSTSKRFTGGCVEHVADFDDNSYPVNTVADGKMLTVLNHVGFLETGSAFIDDYRLRIGGKQ